MSTFDHTRLKQAAIQLDIEGLRRGAYTDRYFTNVVRVLSGLSKEGYVYRGSNPRQLPALETLAVGDVIVEAQIFNRRSPIALIAGIDVALNMLRYATGEFNDRGDWVETWQQLEVDAVQDGDITYYDGDPADVLTVIEIRGRYRDFALLETPILGVLSRASRIATNVYEVLQVSNGKQVLYYPARFDVPQVQAMDGYAYWLAVQRYNAEYRQQTPAIVSTDAQGAWWGGHGKGTIPHALIACFGADDVEMMLNFTRHIAPETPRILLADFNNDTVGASVATLTAFWQHYAAAYAAGDERTMTMYTLNGVRLDTGAKLRDASLDADDPKGVSPVLVRTVRNALNNAWHTWDVPPALVEVAKDFCRRVQIVVTGGFNREKVEAFERARAPVDAYGVGSSLLSNAKETNTDFTMDVVRIYHEGRWLDVPKVGRRPCDNPDLQRVSLHDLEDGGR
ncbi:MAG: nicotinate phosphoribosyltransferase [Anaerolineae bacterium]|nr:nicotinate phosphoribosyltransferase [Anaerolineae bacterium]